EVLERREQRVDLRGGYRNVSGSCDTEQQRVKRVLNQRRDRRWARAQWECDWGRRWSVAGNSFVSQRKVTADRAERTTGIQPQQLLLVPHGRRHQVGQQLPIHGG